MDKVTVDQAAVISAYTGYLLGPFSAMHKYAEKVLGRPIWTHEFASESLTAELREASMADFISLSPDA